MICLTFWEGSSCGVLAESKTAQMGDGIGPIPSVLRGATSACRRPINRKKSERAVRVQHPILRNEELMKHTVRLGGAFRYTATRETPLCSFAEVDGRLAEVGKEVVLKLNVHSELARSVLPGKLVHDKTQRALREQKIQIEDWLLFNKNALGVGTGGQGLIKTHNHSIFLRMPSREYTLIFSRKTLKKLFETGSDKKIALWPTELYRHFLKHLSDGLDRITPLIPSKWGDLINVREPRLRGKYSKYIVVFDPREIEIEIASEQTVEDNVAILKSTVEVIRCNERAHAILRVRNKI